MCIVGAVCGICGVVQSRPDQLTRRVAEQLATQRHRGPDAEGWFDGGVAVVAQNRLSIIDLVTGDPPMTNEDGTIGAVLNGEIYNFRVLREQLLALPVIESQLARRHRGHRPPRRGLTSS